MFDFCELYVDAVNNLSLEIQFGYRWHSVTMLCVKSLLSKGVWFAVTYGVGLWVFWLCRWAWSYAFTHCSQMWLHRDLAPSFALPDLMVLIGLYETSVVFSVFALYYCMFGVLVSSESIVFLHSLHYQRFGWAQFFELLMLAVELCVPVMVG